MQPIDFAIWVKIRHPEVDLSRDALSLLSKLGLSVSVEFCVPAEAVA